MTDSLSQRSQSPEIVGELPQTLAGGTLHLYSGVCVPQETFQVDVSLESTAKLAEAQVKWKGAW